MSAIYHNNFMNNSPPPVSIEGTKTILHQMEYCICKICENDGTGFFCKIYNRFKNEFMKVLFTNSHILLKVILKIKMK